MDQTYNTPAHLTDGGCCFDFCVYTWQYRNYLCLVEEVLLHSHLKTCTFKTTILLEVQIKTWIINSLCTDQTLNVRKRQIYVFC